jgi:YesN/AraC family two-component response regulator
MGDLMSLAENRDLLKCFRRDVNIIKLNLQEQHYVETMLASMDKEFKEAKENYDLYVKTQLIQLLIFMNRRSSNLQDNDIDYSNAVHKTLSEITAYINTNYREDISLSTISKKFFISPYHLSRTFEKNTGFTFIEYLNGIRIKEAQNLLRKTNKTISEIAEMVGYNNATHFGRVFKNITGVSPITFKKSMYKNN